MFNLNRKIVFASLMSLLLLVPLVACSNNSSSSGKKTKNTTITYLTNDTKDKSETKVIYDLSQAYKKDHPNVNFKVQTVQQTDLTQKIQLASSSNSLPALFKYNETSQLKSLIKANQILDIGSTFKKLGIYDKLNPAAVQLLKRITGTDKLYSVPLELNVEGFWYNKKIFSDNGLSVPKTWDEMLQDAAVLKSKGVQPFSVAGKEQWPITRLINAYVIRKYGADAMDKVAKGKLKVTDPGFLKAAQIVQDMDKKGYFGKGVNTVDYNTALDTFLQGKAAIYYMGSWALANFNDPKQNKIGVDNIGFFNIPLVKGGVGTLNDYSMNTGAGTTFAKNTYNDNEGQWMKKVFSQYGDKAMNELGMITGFKVSKLPNNLSPLTKMTLKNINKAKNGALWFEAEMDQKSSLLAQKNAQLLVTGDMSPDNYLKQLQQSIDNNNK